MIGEIPPMPPSHETLVLFFVQKIVFAPWLDLDVLK